LLGIRQSIKNKSVACVGCGIVLLLVINGCTRKPSNQSFIEFIFNGQSVRWEGIQFSVTWPDSDFVWSCPLESSNPSNLMSWSDGPNAERTLLPPVSVIAYGSPQEIEVLEDLPGKTLLAKQFILGVRHPNEKENFILSCGFMGSKAIPLALTIDRVDFERKWIFGSFKGQVTVHPYGHEDQQLDTQGTVEGHFAAPLIPVEGGVAFPETRAEALSIGNQYSPKHYVTLETIRKAVESENPQAEYQFAIMNLFGHGVPEDEKKADQWTEKAAADGLSKAQLSLAAKNQANPPESYFWACVALFNGDPGGKPENWKNVTNRLRADQMATIEKRAAKWVKDHPKHIR
jgi:hypothetical protein